MRAAITVLKITKDDTWVYVHLSNHCVVRMTMTCLNDLGWRIGTTF